MPAQFHSAPDENYTVSNQPLIYTLKHSTTLPAGHRFIVRVLKNTNEIAKLYLVANDSSRAHFDLSQVVRNRVEQDVSNATNTSAVFDISAMCTYSKAGTDKFQVKIGTYSDSSGEVVDEATKSIYLVRGAFQTRDGLHPNFTEYIGTTASRKCWLTDLPEGDGSTAVGNVIDVHGMDSDDKAVMAFIHDSTVNASANATHVRLVVWQDIVTPLAATNLEIATNGGVDGTLTNYKNKLCYVGIGPANVEQWAPDGYKPSDHPNWQFYTIDPATSAALQRGARLKVHRYCGVYKNDRVLVAFANSKGGWDYLKFDGRMDKEQTVQNKTYNKLPASWNGADYVLPTYARSRDAYQITSKFEYTLKRLGMTAQEYVLLQQMMKSHNVMMKITGDSALDDRNVWLPVTVTGKMQSIKDQHSSTLFDVTVKVELAQDERC